MKLHCSLFSYEQISLIFKLKVYKAHIGKICVNLNEVIFKAKKIR